MAAETIGRTFAVEPPARLRVTNLRGRVEIIPGEAGEIAITATRHPGGSQPEIVLEQDADGRVVVEARRPDSITQLFGLGKPGKVDFKVRVPPNCSVSLISVGSDAQIEGLTGDFNLSNVSGDLTLRDLTGSFALGNVSGKVEATNLRGTLKFSTVSGRVWVADADFSAVEGKTVSGQLWLQTPLGGGPYWFNSVSGHVTLIVPEETVCRVRHQSVGGRVRVLSPAADAEGGAEVILRSVSGQLLICPAGAEGAANPMAEPQPEKPAAPRKSAMQILDEIESGGLSVSDALDQLTP